MGKNIYALTFVSPDKPGVVALVAKAMYANGFNVQDSSSTRLRGIFSMILLVVHDKLYTEDEVKSFFPAEYQPSVYILNNGSEKEVKSESYAISVYGADKPGIIYKIASTLSDYNVNIVDLQTQSIGTPPDEVYIMILEAVPQDGSEEWISAVKKAAVEIHTDITVRRYETYEL